MAPQITSHKRHLGAGLAPPDVTSRLKVLPEESALENGELGELSRLESAVPPCPPEPAH